MPRYEYQCEPCKEVVEVERRISDDELIPGCPSCHRPTKRVYGIAGAHFKGQGWGKTYRTYKPKDGNG